METIIYLIIYFLIFIIGSLIGSFTSLAIHRIPKKENIIYKRSYCPWCNHELKLIDLFPIFSFLFLRGKCRYCKNKIRKRYIILEIFSGIAFLLFAMSFKINLLDLNIMRLVYLGIGVLYITGLIIIAGIEKENKHIQKSLLVYEIIVELIYIIYLYISQENIYRYGIYLLMLLALIIIDNIMLKKKNKSDYTIQTLILCMILFVFTKSEVFVATVILTLVLSAIKLIKNKENTENLPIGFFLCISNIVVLIIQNFLSL